MVGEHGQLVSCGHLSDHQQPVVAAMRPTCCRERVQRTEPPSTLSACSRSEASSHEYFRIASPRGVRLCTRAGPSRWVVSRPASLSTVAWRLADERDVRAR